MLVLIIIIVALAVIFKLWLWIDHALMEYNKKSLVIKEPESEEEKKAVSTALSLYHADEKTSVLLCRPDPEKEQKHDKILIIFYLLVLFVVLMAIGLIIAIV